MRERDLATLGFARVRSELARFAASGPGRERCLGLAPSNDPAWVAAELDRTAACVRLLAEGQAPPQPQFADVRPWLREASREGFVLDGAALAGIRHVLRAARAAARFFRGRAAAAPELADLPARIPSVPLLEGPLERMLDDDGQVRDDACEELRAVRRSVRALRQTLAGRLERLLSEKGVAEVLSDRFVTIRNDRYVIPVRAAAAGRIPGVVQDRSVSGETVFVEPLFAVELNNQLMLAVKEEQRIVRRILADLSDLVRLESDSVSRAFGVLVEVDVLIARARLAFEYRCVRPHLDPDGAVALREARHPGLLFAGKPVVPVDLVLEPGQSALVITGPNTGGKTVAMKTMGLCAAMAQSGLLVPAREGARLPVFGAILADIGDEQDVERDLSTFSGHVRNLCEMLRQAHDGALVLLDEPGVGTDPDEGAALAVALLDEFRRRGARVVVTTHYTRLKLHALEDPQCVIAAVDFDVDRLMPAYRLSYGSLGQSLGLAIAARLGLPQAVVDRARAAAGPGDAVLRSALERLEELRRELEAARGSAERAAREAERRAREAERLEAEAGERRRRAWRQAAREARAYVEETEREARRLLRELAAGRADRGAVRRFARQRQEVLSSRSAPPQPPGQAPAGGSLAPGMEVELAGSGLRGELVAVDGGRAWVRRGSMRFEVPVARLRAAGRPSATAVRVSVENPGEVEEEISLLGLRVPEALSRLERFLDRACRAQLPRVRIVHGLGSGALCRAVRAHLDSSPYCVEARPAPPEQGGERATIAVLSA